MIRVSTRLLTGCIVMAACTSIEAGAAPGLTDVIAHRGASAYAPENTLAAFALAAEMGANWFELDCTLTRDGEVIVIHDDTIDRTTGAKGSVAEMTLSELKQYDVGSWFDPKFAEERFPTLGEALDLAKEKRIGVYVEIKNSDDDRELMRELLALEDRARVERGLDLQPPALDPHCGLRIDAARLDPGVDDEPVDPDRARRHLDQLEAHAQRVEVERLRRLRAQPDALRTELVSAHRHLDHEAPCSVAQNTANPFPVDVEHRNENPR